MEGVLNQVSNDIDDLLQKIVDLKKSTKDNTTTFSNKIKEQSTWTKIIDIIPIQLDDGYNDILTRAKDEYNECIKQLDNLFLSHNYP